MSAFSGHRQAGKDDGLSYKAAVDKIAVASDHNILAHSDKSDARGLATLAAVRRQWRPQVPIRSITTDVRSFYEGRAVVNDACGNDGG